MNSIQCLLDKLGKPPREVCADWAWQLQQLGQINVAGNQVEDQLTWHDVIVDEDGSLRIERAADQPDLSADSRRTLRELCQELLSWCEEKDVQLDIEHIVPSLQNLTLQLASPNATPVLSANQTTEADVSKVAVAVEKAASHSANSRRNSASQADEGLKHRPSLLSGRPAIITAISCVTLLLMLFGWRFFFARAETEIPLAKSPDLQPRATSTSRTPAAESALRESNFEGNESSISRLPDATATLSGPFAREVASAESTLSNSLNDLKLPSLVPPAGKSNANNTASSEVTGVDSLAADAVDLTTDNVDSEYQSQPTGETMDVLSTMAEVARQSELAKTETEMLAAGDPSELDALRLHPPMLLPTFPMFQIYKLPASLKARAKNPAWQIRLAVSEGFTIEPNTPQTISGKEAATWLIKDEKTDGATAQILVQTQATGTRGSNLRWRIVAGAPDIPQVAFPLGRKYLDAMQQNLSSFATRLQFEIDRLRSVSSVDGIPGKVRSAITSQRKGYEAQQKLLARVLEVVADANQMEGWLDGQFEVHARYLDLPTRPDQSDADELKSANSPALLQFGEFPDVSQSEPTSPEAADASVANEGAK